MKLETINDFIKNYKNKYDKFNITIYPKYSVGKDNYVLYNNYKLPNTYVKQNIKECIFRDTRIRENNKEIFVDRIRKFVFEYKELLIVVTFIVFLKLTDIPLITKYHDEKNIITHTILKNDYFQIDIIIENNQTKLNTITYSSINLNDNLFLSKNIIKLIPIEL